MTVRSGPIIILGPYTVGERPDPIEHTFEDADGEVIDLTGYTATATLLVPGETEGGVITATIPAPTSGTARVDLADLLDTDGTYQLEIWVSQVGGRRYASPLFRFHTRPAIPTA